MKDKAPGSSRGQLNITKNREEASRDRQQQIRQGWGRDRKRKGEKRQSRSGEGEKRRKGTLFGDEEMSEM